MSLKKSPSLFFWFSISTRWHVWEVGRLHQRLSTWDGAAAGGADNAVFLDGNWHGSFLQEPFSMVWIYLLKHVETWVSTSAVNNTLGGAEVPDIGALREAQGQRVVVATWQSQVGRQLAPRVGRHHFGASSRTSSGMVWSWLLIMLGN